MGFISPLLANRFDRQLRILGTRGQERLWESTALIVGVGGLGSFEALLLAYAGIGKIILVDRDVVEESNLNRQVLHWARDKGKPKVVSAREKLVEINPYMEVEGYSEPVTYDLVLRLAGRADIVLDGLDNWESRFIVDKAAWEKGKPFIHAGVEEFYGQVAPILRGKTPCLRCIMRGVSTTTGRPSVIVTTVSAIASFAVLEAIKILTGVGSPIYGKMAFIDTLGYEINVVDISGLECNDIC